MDCKAICDAAGITEWLFPPPPHHDHTVDLRLKSTANDFVVRELTPDATCTCTTGIDELPLVGPSLALLKPRPTRKRPLPPPPVDETQPLPMDPPSTKKRRVVVAPVVAPAAPPVAALAAAPSRLPHSRG